MIRGLREGCEQPVEPPCRRFPVSSGTCTLRDVVRRSDWPSLRVTAFGLPACWTSLRIPMMSGCSGAEDADVVVQLDLGGGVFVGGGTVPM